MQRFSRFVEEYLDPFSLEGGGDGKSPQVPPISIDGSIKIDEFLDRLKDFGSLFCFINSARTGYYEILQYPWDRKKGVFLLQFHTSSNAANEPKAITGVSSTIVCLQQLQATNRVTDIAFKEVDNALVSVEFLTVLSYQPERGQIILGKV